MKTDIKKIVVALFVSAVLFVGCSDDENPTGPENLPATANVKVVHASPDAPGVDLLVDDKVAGSNLTYPNNTGYLEVTKGTRNVKVNVAGTSTTVVEANLDLEADINYSVFATDAVANLTPIVIQDDLSAPTSGNAHARFIHLSPNAPAVDITLTDGTVVFGNIKFQEYTAFTHYPLQHMIFK